MAITSLISTQQGPTLWLFTAVSGLASPTFYWWVNGALYLITNSATLLLTIPAGASVRVDVFDDLSSKPDAIGFPSEFVLVWDGVGLDIGRLYLVEKWDSTAGAWVRTGYLPERGQAQYVWRSGPLADETEHSFRVLSAGQNGERGRVREVTQIMCRYPDAPTVAHVYDEGTQQVTVTVS